MGVLVKETGWMEGRMAGSVESGEVDMKPSVVGKMEVTDDR